MNMTVQNNDLGSVDLFGTVYQPNSLVLSAAVIVAGIISEGLILARDTATGNLIDFIDGDAGDAGIPVAVVGANQSLPSGVGATDIVALSPIVSGQVRRNRLLTSAAATITDVIVDQLRDYSIVAQHVDDVSKLDNQ
jgi:hypothetical protein